MFGAVCGDVIGSCYENHATKDYDFRLFRRSSRFTDDTVLTAAVCDAILFHPEPIRPAELYIRAKEYAVRYKAYYARHPHAGFGHMFRKWAKSDMLYKQSSYGNGGAMRVVPIGCAYEDIKQIELQVHASCLYTHAHPEAVKGAKAAADAVFLARTGHSKEEIRSFLTKRFHYDLQMNWDALRSVYSFSSRTIDSVPHAIQAFLDSTDYEDAIRRAISLGGDADTMACIAGGIAEAFYGSVPEAILHFCKPRIDSGLRETLERFRTAYTKT